MARAARAGEILDVKGRPLQFSYFPVRRGKRRAGLFDALFTQNPWNAMRGAITSALRGPAREEALAFLGQGRDFYEVATGRLSTNPLLLHACLRDVPPRGRQAGYRVNDLDRSESGV